MGFLEEITGTKEAPLTEDERKELRHLRNLAEHLKNKIETKSSWKKHKELEYI